MQKVVRDKKIPPESGFSLSGTQKSIHNQANEILSHDGKNCKIKTYSANTIFHAEPLQRNKSGNGLFEPRFAFSLHGAMKEDIPEWLRDNRYYLDGDRRACLKRQISESGYYEMYGNENYTGVKYHKLANNARKREDENRGIRKQITEFTKRSRLNFLKRTNEIDWKSIPKDRQYMITLTYEIEAYEKYRNDGRAIKKQLDQFFREFDILMKRYRISWSAIWVLEFQKNTHNPHFHMVILLSENIVSRGKTLWILRNWIKPVWARIIGGSEKSERVGTDVQNIKHSVIGYFAKYCGKEGIQKKAPEGYQGLGRFWGIRGRNAIKWLNTVMMIVDYEDAIRIKRIMRRLLKKRGYKRRAGGDPRSAVLCFGLQVDNIMGVVT